MAALLLAHLSRKLQGKAHTLGSVSPAHSLSIKSPGALLKAPLPSRKLPGLSSGQESLCFLRGWGEGMGVFVVSGVLPLKSPPHLSFDARKLGEAQNRCPKTPGFPDCSLVGIDPKATQLFGK